MRIVIFGASGRTGLPLLQQALDAGHDGVAFVRSPAKLPIKHARLSVVQGDAVNAADVEKAIAGGADAVISVLSPVKGQRTDLLPIAVDNIVASMKRHHVSRLVYMTGAGVDMPEDRPQLINHVIKFLLKSRAGDVLEASVQAVNKVQASGLEWVIIRAPMLNDNPHSGQIRVGWVGVNTGPRLSRADAADFILKQLNGTSYLHKAPVISN